jgi:hypothetical protein
MLLIKASLSAAAEAGEGAVGAGWRTAWAGGGGSVS